MNVEQFPREKLITNLKKINLISETNLPISYNEFKNKSTIHKFNNNLKIVFSGTIKDCLIGFYIEYNTDQNCMKQAYKWYLKMVKAKDITQCDIHIGNGRIPNDYEYISYSE
jgi:hypothetical protein